jgi:hypothetical protein
VEPETKYEILCKKAWKYKDSDQLICIN